MLVFVYVSYWLGKRGLGRGLDNEIVCAESRQFYQPRLRVQRCLTKAWSMRESLSGSKKFKKKLQDLMIGLGLREN